MLWAANRILQGRLPSVFNRASLTYLALLCLNIGDLLGSDGCCCVLGLLLVSQATGLMNLCSLEELCSLCQADMAHTATSSGARAETVAKLHINPKRFFLSIFSFFKYMPVFMPEFLSNYSVKT